MKFLLKLIPNIIQLYNAYKDAIAENQLLEPEGECADYYYSQLLQVEVLHLLRAALSRNFAAALIDEAQQITNKLLITDPFVVSDTWSRPFVFDHIPGLSGSCRRNTWTRSFLSRALEGEATLF